MVPVDSDPARLEQAVLVSVPEPVAPTARVVLAQQDLVCQDLRLHERALHHRPLTDQAMVREPVVETDQVHPPA